MRVGYYVNNEYMDEQLAAEPPSKPVIEKIRRNILAEKPRVTRFAIKWYTPLSPLLSRWYVANGLSGTPKPPHRLNSRRTSPRQMRFLMTKRPMAPMMPRKKDPKLPKLVQLAPRVKMLRWTAPRSLSRPRRKWTMTMPQARSADNFVIYELRIPEDEQLTPF